MAYRWRQDGPAFEFPTPYGTENRFLTLRGWLLLVAAVLVLLVAAFAGSSESDRPVIALEKLPEPGSVWPHVAAAMLLVLWGALDLVQAAGQRVLLLAPGQPASLVPEVSREGAGVGNGSPSLMQALSRGMAAPAELARPYRRGLQKLGNDLPYSPGTLHAYMRARMSHLVLGGGLLVTALATLLWPKPGGAALGALLVMALGIGVITRHALHPDRPALKPWAIAAIAGAALVGAAALAFAATHLPLLDKLDRFALPAGAVALVLGGMLFEGMGLLAARAHVELPRPGKTGADETSVSFDVHPTQLLREVDRELDRRWSEGVPNRRYAWQPPKIDPTSEVGSFSATVLEESQPQISAPGRGTPLLGDDTAARRRWLLALDSLGLLLSVVGALLWVHVAWVHMLDSAALWTSSSVGLALLLAGSWAPRVGHFLWSRIEVDSTITWLEFKGAYFRLPGAVPPPVADSAGWSRAEAPVGVEELALRSCVVQARSVFYAAGTYELGSRTLISVMANPAAAAVWTTLAQDFARKSAASPAATTPAALAAKAKARERRVAEREQTQAAPRKAARFCSACGTPVLSGARFCQQCGNTLSVD